MVSSDRFLATELARIDRSLSHLLHALSAYWIPILFALLSLLALGFWSSHYTGAQGTPLSFKVLHDTRGSLQPAEALQHLQAPDTRAVTGLSNALSRAPFWLLLQTPLGSTAPPKAQTIEFPSRHAQRLDCWDAATLAPLGAGTRTALQGALQYARAGFALDPAGSSALLCRTDLLGPGHISALHWNAADLESRKLQFHRGSGLLEGGILTLALFTLIAGLVNRNRTYLLLAAWLVLNLRMAALSMGWDTQWLGQTVPPSWLLTLRPLTLALYYAVTFTLFVSLLHDELDRVGGAFLTTAIKWSCLPLLLLALSLPYTQFLPIIWLLASIGLCALLFLLAKIFLRTHSRVAVWYAAAISVALFANLLEVAAAALGLKGLVVAFNSVTAALASSLLASLAIAEQIRQAHQQRLAAQAELQHTYEVLPIGLFTLDLQGHLSSANPALLQMLGANEGELRKQTWPQRFGPNHWQALLEQTRSSGTAELEVLLQPTQQLGPVPPRRFQVRAALAGDKLECTLQDITEKAQATEHLKFLAHHDTLTKVLNRRGIEQVLSSGLADLGRGHPLAVAYLDLDRFKLINDLYGHAAGDAVLHLVCQRAQTPLIRGMRLGRVGGDEFLIVMPHTPLAQAEAVCREILHQIGGSACQVGERAFQVRGSIGLIEVASGSLAKDVVATSDHACRIAKKGHGNTLVVFDRSSGVFTDHEAQMHLVEQLANQQSIEGLFLEMQPIMSLRTPHGSHNFEVLLRMCDEHGQRVPTERLIHAAEIAGRMSVIDRWVLAQTLGWLEQHQQELLQTRFVCINLSGASLNDERFIDDVFSLLERHRSVAERICLEITESVALHDMENTRRFIDRVRAVGAKVALDDFGAGYTSFSYLKELPADLLKIDGSFIVNMNRHPANVAIVEAIVSLAQNLGMKTIAEWAEDFETVETLAEIGVDYVQGFVVARPQPPQAMLAVESGADFITDEKLKAYLSTLAPSELDHVDLVLGADPPAATPDRS